MEIVYFLLAVIATTIGAAAGIGGGIVIKPVLDSISSYSLPTVNLLSSATIFAMAVVSIGKQIAKKDKIDVKRTMIIAGGSIIGGVIGQNILKILVSINKHSESVSILQSTLIIVLLLSVFFYMRVKDRIKKRDLNSSLIIAIIGIILGAISAFLGIGGGPINVAIFATLFSMDTKEAARNSIIVILFSQGAKILSIAVTTGFSSYNLKVLPVMVIGGILGGLLGYKLNKNLSEKNIMRIFNATIILIVFISSYSIYRVI
ncbi:TSUP family transporter [Clostridium sardiniense]|uniref:TSUP family transporter n=1 Tax=Clostridium sardiniense TaxID=29369 RepID=UPI003D326AEC